MAVGFICVLALGFNVLPSPLSGSRLVSQRQAMRMSTGFGEKKIVGKVQGKTRPGAYDKLKTSGVPEYSVFVRADESADWRAAGVLCVPRTASVAEAVAKAIYSRENELTAAVTKAHADLAKVPAGTLQFGFRAAEFDADPIRMVTREMGQDKKNFFQKFVEDLNNPINREE